MIRAWACLCGAVFLSSLLVADEKKEGGLKLSDDEQAVLDLTNAERKKAKVPPLTPSAELFEAARSHSRNMARQDKMEHDLDGKTPFDRITAAGYVFSKAGENIAWNAPTPKDVVQMWMESPPHKANLLNEKFTQIGIGVAKNSKGEPYWTQDFGTPRK